MKSDIEQNQYSVISLEILWCVQFALTSIATDHINFKIELQEFMETNFSPDIIANTSVLKISDEILAKYELLYFPPKPEFGITHNFFRVIHKTALHNLTSHLLVPL